MKNLIPLLLALLLFSCSKDEETTGDGDGGNELGTFSAIVDGTALSSSSVTASIFDEAGTQRKGLTILGIETLGSTTSRTLTLTFSLDPMETLEAKNYQFTDCLETVSPICGWLLYVDLSDGFTAASLDSDEGGMSTVTISDIDFQAGGFIKGTFSGVIINEDSLDPINVTDGKFNVKIL